MADKAQFEQAQKDVKTLSKKPDNDDLLFLYAHYKQGSAGDVSGKRPACWIWWAGPSTTPGPSSKA